MRQERAGLWRYKPGNILLVHYDTSNTSDKFEKPRRKFNKLGIFHSYVNGNVLVQLIDNKTPTSLTKVPIYYTVFYCDSFEDIHPYTWKELDLIF
jgi:hypothetical protein